MPKFPPIPEQPAPYRAMLDYARQTYGEAVAGELEREFLKAAARNRRAATLAAYAAELPRLRQRLAETPGSSRKAGDLARKIALREAALANPQAYIDDPRGEA